MKLEVHILTHDDEQMLEWALRHWNAMGAAVIMHDGGPKGISEQIRKGFACCKRITGAPIQGRVWDTAGELNDELARRLKNECWRATGADWVAVVDADELLYFPEGAEKTLETYERIGAAVIKPSGFEMFSESWHEASELPGIQLTDFVKHGSPDNKWYAKPVLFSPKRVAESGFGIGAHQSEPVLHDGRRIYVGPDWPKANPPTYLLHFKSIFGGLERIASRYDATRERLALVNVRNGWGNMKPGRVHAQEKRDLLLPYVRRVIG